MRIAIAYPPLKSEKGVALLTQNRQFQWFSRPTYIFPVVPATAATMLKKAGHEVLFLDGIASELSPEAFDAQLSEFRPDLVVLETKTPVVKRHWKWIAEHLPGGMDGTSGGPAPLPMEGYFLVETPAEKRLALQLLEFPGAVVRAARLKLCALFGTVLSTGLGLLGIDTPRHI